MINFENISLWKEQGELCFKPFPKGCLAGQKLIMEENFCCHYSAPNFPIPLRMANGQVTHRSLCLNVISDKGPTCILTLNFANYLTLCKIRIYVNKLLKRRKSNKMQIKVEKYKRYSNHGILSVRIKTTQFCIFS